MKILTIVGNRPQFIKLGVTARRLRQLGADAPFESVVVNTGQHYDQMLADVFFTELEIEAPDYDLGMGSGHIVDQIGKMLSPLRDIVEREAPDALLVYGDTNSTIAGAIVAGHLDVPLVHVEGGERLYRRSSMPEEVNRIVTDHLADLCLASSRKAVRYLAREGFGPERVQFVGDPMYDIFKLAGEMLQSRAAAQPQDFGLERDGFALCTMHRAENTDDQAVCLGLLGALDDAPLPVLLPAHPRLRHRLEGWGWQPRGALRLVDPLGYFDFQSMLRQCAVAVTDSGGVGREAFFAGKASIVPLESSAWIEAVEAGMAVMTGQNAERLGSALRSFRQPADVTDLIEQNFGSGDAGARIVDAVAAFVDTGGRRGEGPWHPVARFEVLPRAADASQRSHAAFAELLRRHVAAGRGAEALVLDVTRSRHGAGALVALAESAGVRLTIWLDPGRAGYNPLSDETVAELRQLAGSGHQIAANDQPYAEWLAQQIGAGVSVLLSGGWQDDAATDAGPNWADQLDWSANAAPVMVRPWRWGKVPVSDLEARLSLADEARDAAWRELRETLG